MLGSTAPQPKNR